MVVQQVEQEAKTVRFDNHQDQDDYLDDLSPQPELSDATIENFLEYLDGPDRIWFFNRLSDALLPGAKVHIVVPYFSHPQAFANWALKWPPLCEFSFYFLDAAWRAERPYTQQLGYTADLVLYTYEYEMVDDWVTRHDKVRAEGVRHNLGVVTKLYVTLIKPDRVPETNALHN